MIHWGEAAVENHRCVVYTSEGVSFWIAREDDEWQIAFESYSEADGRGDERIGQEIEKPDDREWTRIVTSGQDTLELVPALPDKPIVVRPESVISIMPGREARLYCSIPLWLRFVSRQQAKQELLHEVPSLQLSKIWFGDPLSGELCYSLDSQLSRSYEGFPPSSLSAVCPLQVRNGATERLLFERICVHVEHLNLYGSRDRLWTNQVNVLFRGADQVSQVTLSMKPPKDTSLITPQRVKVSRSFIKKSFNFLRQVTGM